MHGYYKIHFTQLTNFLILNLLSFREIHVKYHCWIIVRGVRSSSFAIRIEANRIICDVEAIRSIFEANHFRIESLFKNLYCLIHYNILKIVSNKSNKLLFSTLSNLDCTKYCYRLLLRLIQFTCLVTKENQKNPKTNIQNTKTLNLVQDMMLTVCHDLLLS